MHDAMRTILECVGEEHARPGLLDISQRYAKAMMFFTKDYGQNFRDIVNNAIFYEDYNEMVVVKDIEVFSMCEHHMIPFMGKMYIGFILYHSVIGLLKLPRIAECSADACRPKRGYQGGRKSDYGSAQPPGRSRGHGTQ
ncbi:GTP cyclohydrolase I-domain-containing protein [Corynascus novoguineensis]|uniref:GTP cyclohydrolase 1 n=1 Tax=Corynascus novoguineensis TaxID=1126955 RepID=A0AAN7HRZ7_9PEZI|nr:GTP cyclohydrolase I-domain-containing protein [Corynascus novoguineensis]